MNRRVLVPLAEGFEETEAVAIIDVLRRAGAEVVSAAVGGARAPSRLVTGSHGIAIEADTEIAEVDGRDFDMIVLPGGMPGSAHLAGDERVLALVRELHAAGRTTAAICAAPIVLAAAGVVSGVPVTSHPSVRTRLGDADVRGEPRVVRSGTIVTSQGPGTALEFALALAAELAGESKAAELAKAMLVR